MPPAVLIRVLAVFGGQALNTVGSGQVISAAGVDDSYAIYSHVITEAIKSLHLGDANPHVAINLQTVAPRRRAGSCFQVPVAQERTYRDQIADFDMRNRVPVLLEDRFLVPMRYIPVTASEARSAACVVACRRGCGPADACPFTEGDRTRFRDIRAVVSVSAVGFNRDHTRALVYWEILCGQLCGKGRFSLLVEKNGQWAPDREFKGPPPSCMWIS
jgi:hypothetical protein